VAIFLTALLTIAAPARAESPAQADSEPVSFSSLGIKGTATFKNFSHFRETSNDHRNFRDEVSLQLEWARRLAPWSSVKVVVEARGDDAGFTRGVTLQIPETNERRSILNLKEAVISFQRGPVETTLGKQIFTWGTADAFNPTDNINPYDYMDVIDNQKLGVYSAAARLTVGPANLAFVVVPVFTPSRSFLADNRWFPPVPEGFEKFLLDRELPSTDFENVQYAARVRTTFKGWDVSASYYEGFEHTLVIKREFVRRDIIIPIPIFVPIVVPVFTPVFTRIRVPGFDFSTTYRKFEFHGEGAFRFVERNGRDDRFQWIVGLNYTWDELELRWLEQILLILEYAREEILTSRPNSPFLERVGFSGGEILFPKDAFRNALAGRILFKFNEETQFKLSGTINFFDRTPSYYLQLKLEHKVTDAFHIQAGLDFLGGKLDTFWGRWRDNDRFFCSLKYFF
jgi:hypothetical protein